MRRVAAAAAAATGLGRRGDHEGENGRGSQHRCNEGGKLRNTTRESSEHCTLAANACPSDW
jgi:hypothetical protein